MEAMSRNSFPMIPFGMETTVYRLYSTCRQFNKPPWFMRNLPRSTTDDIELRICLNNVSSHNDVPLQLTELYIIIGAYDY